MSYVLVTGGAGYIGSHACVELLQNGYDIIVVDNLSNSSPIALERIKEITKRDFTFYNIDLVDKENLETIFKKHYITHVIHFAGYKSVKESTEYPLKYYHNNIVSSINLCEIMLKYHCYKLVFSSSATVYGNPKTVPVTENAPVSPFNPYGYTKYFIEQILTDINTANPKLSIALLRYFNPIGAHKSGLIGEDPKGIPNNLLPYISQVAVGKHAYLTIYGNDYNTKDGTGIRDYIHVIDLVQGHIKALQFLDKNRGTHTFNLGTGKGKSVLEIVDAFENASNKKIPYQFSERRPGDIDECYADVTLANKILNWKTTYNLYDMCLDTWHWQKNNCNGYE